VVSETSSGGSFRHLSYYAKDHNLYGFGWDRRGDLGFLFHAFDRRTTYSVDKLAHASHAALLPTEIDTLIVTDGMLLERWDETSMASMERLQLRNGTTVGIVHLTRPGAIEVENPRPDGPLTLADGFPSSADARSDEAEAQVRVVPASVVTERHPTTSSPGVLD
jgi:hypothetical protein